ncbi:MAG: DUF1638 domain-containing protein [Armatimonadetes bacterium]|nr:DUF1638 domain-containing protein [Armatimonadota bacterium]
MRYQLIACEIMLREAALRAATSPNVIDLHFLTKGLHDNPDALRERVQAKIDALDGQPHDAVILGYALCSNGAVGLQARSTPLIVPRAHDCITFFLGSKALYAQRHSEKPGTYYYTAGWIERDAAHAERRPADGAGLDQSFEALVAKYGEDNARFLMDFQNQWISNYTTAAYIKTELGHRPDVEAEARRAAESHEWEFEIIEGSDRLIRALIDGAWNEEEFLVVPPGHRVVAAYDERIIGAEGPPTSGA